MCLFNFLGCVGERAWQSSQRHYAPYISTFYCFSSLSKVVSLFVTSSLFCFCCCSACPSHFFFFLVVRASPFFFLLLCLLSSDPFPHFPLTPLFYVSVLRFPTLYICVFLPLLVSNCSSFFTSSPYSLKWKLRFLPFLFSLSMFAAVMVNNTNSNIYVFFFFSWSDTRQALLCFVSPLEMRDRGEVHPLKPPAK